MNLRGTVIAVLCVIELAIVGEAVVALEGGRPAVTAEQRADARTASGPEFVEGGPHQIFDTGAHPALTVDIGYADLTIIATQSSQIEASVSPSTAYGMFRAKAPITAHKDGATIRIATMSESGWSMGDDRMVTVSVPPETLVTVVNAGNIKASGLRAQTSLHSIGRGSVSVEDYNAPALHIATSNGRIFMRQIVAARLEAMSSDGRVEGTALQVRDGSVESDGRVTLGFASGADTLVTAEATNGRISVSGFKGAAFVATARASRDEDDDSSSRTVRVGAGDGRLDVHSSDGNIYLDQEG